MASNRYYSGNARGEKKPDSTPGSGGGYERTPDQQDRARVNYEKARIVYLRKKQAEKERAQIKRGKPRARPNNYRPWDDRPTNS